MLKIAAICLFTAMISCQKSSEVQTEPTLFLRGSFNSWGDDIKFISNNEEFLAQSVFNEGTIEFKIADSEWSKVNLGLSESQTIELDRDIPLVFGGSNVFFYVESDMTSLVFILKKDLQSNYTLRLVKGNIEFKN